MSHNIMKSVYDKDVNKKKVQAYWDNYAAREDWQEGCSGLNSDIRWIDHICDNYDEAETYISDHDSGWYDQLAVMFFDYPELTCSKKYDMLKERYERLHARYGELKDNIHYANVKSSYIACKECGSKISTEHIGKNKNVQNKCPVCHADLRPQSTLELIENAKKNADKAKSDLKEEEKKNHQKQRKKAKIKWLVKIEYHT